MCVGVVVGVTVGVVVFVGVVVYVGVTVGVFVTVGVTVFVGVTVGVTVFVGVFVGVGDGGGKIFILIKTLGAVKSYVPGINPKDWIVDAEYVIDVFIFVVPAGSNKRYPPSIPNHGCCVGTELAISAVFDPQKAGRFKLRNAFIFVELGNILTL